MSKRVTVATVQKMKRQGERIAMLTAYDYPTARLLDEAGVDILLVGDSLGNVVLGYDSTVPVTLADMIHHTRMVSRGAQRALVVADMPFMTYQISPEEALRNAARLLQEGGAQAIKLEGGEAMAPTVSRLVGAGIPVMGHVGLLPQSIHALGGYRVQGKSEAAARQLLRDAEALAAAGAFAVVLELIPRELARLVTQRLTIPTIGIGAGPDCDGQVLVVHDMLGLNTGRAPRFVKRYADLAGTIRTAVQDYVAEVREGAFPGAEHSTEMPEDVVERLY